MGEGNRDSGGRGPRQRHIKLIAEGDTFPLSESEYNPSTQPAPSGAPSFSRTAALAATITLSPLGLLPPERSELNLPPQAATTFGAIGPVNLFL